MPHIEDICGTFWRISGEWVSYECTLVPPLYLRVFARQHHRLVRYRNVLTIWEEP